MKQPKILTKEEVKHLAKLASLEISDEELKKYQTQLSETLDYIDNLKEIDTKQVESDFHTTEATNVYSKDTIDKERILSPKKAMANSKKKKGNYFIVARIL